ncbi:MAG: extracellular solute-binding protein [Ktedonobacteraceae bacterium]|nr:extracellular solute-binding protein [Ktedonobacteraceae bacterium]MBO0789453.1 extracellular solute-binding protein [Ktedonobacteraceae bacterium]
MSFQPVLRKQEKLLRISAFVLLLSLFYLLAACGNTSTGTTSASPCDKATGLTLYSAQGYDSDTAKAFQKQTGIVVKLVDDSTGNLLAKISAERNNPQWDVAWFDGNVTMQTLDNEGYLLKWTSPNMGNYTSLGKQNVPTDHAYYPTGITAAGAIVYNTKHVPAAGLPQDWSDLTKPAYTNLLAENDPAFSGPAYPFIAGIAQVMGGEDQAKQFFQTLKNHGDKIFQTNDPTLNSVESGAREFAIIQDAAYYAAKQAGQPLGIIYPQSGVAALPSEIGIAAHSRHAACAQQFVNWLLSSSGQSVMTHHDPTDGDTYFIAIISGVIPVVTRQTSGINFVTLDVPRWAGVEDELKQWFHTNIVQ